MRFPVKPTRETLLQFVTEEQIFEHYLGAPVDLERAYCSPLRVDNSPNCTLKVMPSGRLWFRDWANGFKGDCFNLVEELYQCDFKNALFHVDKDMNLNVFKELTDTERTSIREQSVQIERVAKQRAVISAKLQAYTTEDLQYWASQGVTAEFLNVYSVFVAKFVAVNGRRVWNYAKDNPIYVYQLPSGAVKCYRPLEKEKARKWISNTFQNDIFGWEQLPATGFLCLITKSLKDIMALRYLGYHSCAVQAEGNDFPEDKMDELKKRFKHVLFFYDNDDAGMAKMDSESVRLNVPYIYVPQFIEGKDTSGLINTHGAKYAKEIIEIDLDKYI